MKFNIYLLLWALAIHPIKVQKGFSKNEDSEHAMFEDVPFPKVGSIPVLNRKIFKGTRVTIREHPYILSIRRKFAHYTVGVLLTQNLVISVAHPLLGVPVQELKIVVGENYADRGTSMNTVLLVIIHEQFDPYTLQADIALLRCHEYLTIRGSVKHIGLIKPGFITRGYVAHVTGWGRCDLTLGNKISPGMICAGFARSEDPMSPCMAVPGAALVIQGRLVGLQSWGFGCGYSHDLPLIYTSVEYYQEWITNNSKILKQITKAQLSQFYQVTKAYEYMEWLELTRGDNASYNIKEGDLQTVKVDFLLARINGTVYDIRNFIFEQKFHLYKTDLYMHLREIYEKKVSNMLRMPLQYKFAPFLDRNYTKFIHEDGGKE